MEQIVELPDGKRLAFPEGMSQDDMRSAIYKNFPDLSPKPALEISQEAQPAKSPEELTLRTQAFAKATGTKSSGEEPTSGLEWMTKPLWEFAQKVNPQQFADAMDALSVSGAQAEGFIDPNEAQDAMGEKSRVPTKLESGLAGAQQAMAGAANFFTSPLGIATLGTTALPGAVQRTVAAAFTVDMARQYPQLVKELSQGIMESDAEKIGRSLTGMGLNTAFIAKGLETTFAKGKAIDPALPALPERLREADAPLTAAQVEATVEGRTVDLTTPVEPAKPAVEGEVLGIAPPGTGKLQQFIDKLMPRERGTPPPINPDTTTPIPDFQPREVSKKIGTEPFGIGRLPVLGPLLDPRTRIRTNLDEAVVAHSYERGVGRAISSSLGEELRGTIDKHFDVDPKTSQIRNIGATQEGQSLHVSDVFEALQKDPNAYTLNPEQRAAFEQMVKLDADMRKLEDKYELFQDAEGEVIPGKPQRKETYFPRIVVERPPTDVAPLQGGGRIGAKQFFQKQRLFETEAEGVAKGYRYEPSIERRIVTRAERLYKAVADKRLADDPVLGARTRQQVESEIREAYSEEIGSGAITEEKLQQIVSSVEAKGKVWDHPAFRNKIFDPETAAVLKKTFPVGEAKLREWVADTNSLLKSLMLSTDMGAPFLQGLGMMYRHRVLWSKAVGKSWQALRSAEVFSRYLRENIEPAREITQMGSTVGRLPEMMAGVERGQALTKLPFGIGAGLRGFGRGFQTFLDVAKIEIWKATREVTPRDQWQARIQEIESELGLGRIESIGIGRNTALLEKMAFLASSYYRGAVNLIGAAIAEKGVSGSQARQAITAYLVGGAALYWGIGKLKGMTDAEIIERMNPFNPDYMMWSSETETGRKYNVGFGGIHRSLIRLAANTVKTSVEHPENWASLTAEKNPLVRWYRGHAAPVPARAWDQFTGKDYMGADVSLPDVFRAQLPLAAQQAIPKEGQPKPSAVDVGLSFLGMSAYPEALHLQRDREREALAQKLFNKPYDDLSLAQAAKVTKEVQAMPAMQDKEPSTALQRERAFKADQERVKRITEGLSDGAREKVNALNVKVAGYDASATAAGTRVPLTRDQQERYEKLIIAEYETAIGRMNTNALGRLPEKRRSEIVSQRFENARMAARRKLFQKP